MELGIEGRTALVMAASSGIGRGIAAALAREGASVAIASRSRERIEAAAAQIDGEATPFVADTHDLDRLAALPGEVAEALGPVEILVTNTGGPPLGGTLDHRVDEWDAAYRALVLAPRTLIEAALPDMSRRRWGRIVNVGSSSMREPIPGLALSNAHRMAAVGLFKTLAAEVAGDGITVNTVATGRFATERLADSSGSLDAAEERAHQEVPARRLGRPEEYGDLVAFLCSDRAAYLTGAVIPSTVASCAPPDGAFDSTPRGVSGPGNPSSRTQGIGRRGTDAHTNPFQGNATPSRGTRKGPGRGPSPSQAILRPVEHEERIAMSEEVEQTKGPGEGKPGEPESEKKKPESDVEKGKADVKDAASGAKEKLGEVADKLKDEDVRKKVTDVAGKLRGRLRR